MYVDYGFRALMPRLGLPDSGMRVDEKSDRRVLHIPYVAFYAAAASIVPIFAIATIYSSGTFGFRAGHASNPDGILALFIAAAVGFALAEFFPMLALSNGGTPFLKSATAIGLIYAGYTMVAATMFAWADRGKEYLEGDRIAQIRLEAKVSKAVLILGTFAAMGTIPIFVPAIT